jgi:release factor glutamine methyltransferase
VSELGPVPYSGAGVVLRLRAAGCVFAEDEARLLLETAASPEHLDELVALRAAGLPLEHVVGWAEFFGVRVVVDPGVFVPRRRSEVLARLAVELCRPGAVVVDMCCGSGALGVALASRVPGLELYAADVDPVAVRCARRNVEPLGGRVLEGDLCAALPDSLRGRIDVLVANAPYVPTAEIEFLPAEAREHEHRVALDGGVDGLDLHRRLAVEAPTWLAPGGHLLIETSERQAPIAQDALAACGLLVRVRTDDDAGATVLVATRPHPM